MFPTAAFTFLGMPRVYSGAGITRNLSSLLPRTDGAVLFLSGSGHLQASGRKSLLLETLRNSGLVVHEAIVHGEPTDSFIDTVVADNRKNHISIVIGVGGGSVLDTGKAVAALLTVPEPCERYLEGIGDLQHPGTTIPFIALPTTSGTGSEATRNAVISRPGPDGFKRSLRHEGFVPHTAILDAELCAGAPPAITASCGLDAFTQLLESYLSRKSSPMTDTLAFWGMELVVQYLERCVSSGEEDLEARSALAWAAFLSGVCLSHAGLGPVHGMAGPLGGLAPIPHSYACASLLAPTMATLFGKLQQHRNNSHSQSIAKMARVGRIFQPRTSGDIAAAEALVHELEGWHERFQIPPLSRWGVDMVTIAKVQQNADAKECPESFSPAEFGEILRMQL